MSPSIANERLGQVSIASKDVELSPRYKESHWKMAFGCGEDWNVAINIVEDRIQGRWIQPADTIAPIQGAGFALLALDCIILEAIWGFKHGTKTENPKDAYREMLMSVPFGWTKAQSDDFRRFVRNGLMHDAETRSRWLVEKTVPEHAMLEVRDGNCVLNRSLFHRAIKTVFSEWILELRHGNAEVRKNMAKRMNALIASHYEPNVIGP